MPGRGEQELDLLGAASSHSSPEYPCQLRVLLLSLGCFPSKYPTHPNPIPDFPLLDVTAEGFPRGESLGVNIPSLWMEQGWPGGSCSSAPGAAQTHRAEPGRGFWESFPTPSLWKRLCPEFLWCTQVCVGLLHVSCGGQGKQRGRSDSNYWMHERHCHFQEKTREVG